MLSSFTLKICFGRTWIQHQQTPVAMPTPTLNRKPSLNKQRSLSNLLPLRRPSPLSQSSIGPDEIPLPRERPRSNSVDSLTSSPPTPLVELVPLPDLVPEMRKSPSKKSLRQTLKRARKSVFRMTTLDQVPIVPPLPESITITAPGYDEVNPSTPMSSRSNPDFSLLSSASSSSSSDGTKTPSEGVLLEVGVAGIKLANALSEVEEKKGKGLSWRGWLGGKRGAKIESTTPPISASSSASSSASNLLDTLTPSPIISPPRSSISTLSSLDRSSFIILDQLRHISHRKMAQLRAPSPHPLALHLKRQHYNLPDEVAFSIQSGQKVFPMSVNILQPVGNGLNPAQGGLWLGIAIRTIFGQLDAGSVPSGTLGARLSPRPSIVPRPKGVLDFLNRPPFEERNTVYFANGTYSPISMARPGYGVEDLEFSKYILALSEMDEPASSWPNISRPSIIDTIGEIANIGAEDLSSPDEEADEIITPVVLIKATPILDIQPEVAIQAAESEIEGDAAPTPLTRSKGKTWADSSDEENDDEDEPLARIVKKASFSGPSRPSSGGPTHVRTRSQPQNVSDEVKHRRAMVEIAQARARREAAIRGETERKAEADRRRRDSSTSSRPPNVQFHPASPRVQQSDNRRRVVSTYDMLSPRSRLEPGRKSSVPETRRYHSFYEAQPNPMYTHHNMAQSMIFPNPAMPMAYQYPSRVSLSIPPTTHIPTHRRTHSNTSDRRFA